MDDAGFSFLDLLRQNASLKKRYGRDYALVRLEIDGLENVEDKAAEQVRQALAECCQASLRDEDLGTLCGDTGFAMLMPETTLARAAVAAERLRTDFQALKLPVSQGTLSAGVTEGRDEDDSGDQVLARAEEALRQAIDEGGNCLRTSEGRSAADGSNNGG